MSRERPTLLLRLAVVVGAFTLLLGMIGVAFIFLQDDEDASAAGPGLPQHVRVTGAAVSASLHVDVCWEDKGDTHREAARPIGDAARLFLLPPGLADRRVTIEVSDQGSAQRLATRELVLGGGREITIDVEQVDDR